MEITNTRPAARPLVARLPRRLSALLAVAVAVLALGASSAYAGTNGQQVYFSPSFPSQTTDLGWVVITGYNQNWQWVQWQGYAGNHSYVYPSWWWKGRITIDYQRGGTWHESHAWIPEGDDRSFQHWPNVVAVNGQGSAKYGTSNPLNLGRGWNVGCVNLSSNPSGSLTWYRRYSGYYLYSDYNRFQYGIAGNITTPAIVTSTFQWFVCG